VGFKLVRDRNEEWCRAHGVSGQWRVSPDPAAALRRKLLEEALEYAEHDDPAELYDVLDVVQALIDLADPDETAAMAHDRKVAKFGRFDKFIEWSPVPEEANDWDPEDRSPGLIRDPDPGEPAGGF
jgi:predicted house-cleaning noncanonical NTP pyrophosphatase (MazG superfamily)